MEELGLKIKMIFSIVPIGDGYHSIGIQNGEYVLVRKYDDESNIPLLLFNSIEEAQNYIDSYMDNTKYKPEPLWRTACLHL